MPQSGTTKGLHNNAGNGKFHRTVAAAHTFQHWPGKWEKKSHYETSLS